ncbi:hypothetical protein [Compostibacter hankyongensis]|uniref:Serine acetyltransferase n=1 Tax=Compostibacter hankyongensis TaxID=1007089 RepID=A0ABP8G919_9BACT
MENIGLKETVGAIRSDLKKHGANSFWASFRTYCFNPSFRLILNYRIGRFYIQKRSPVFKLLVRYYAYKQVVRRSCQISYRADIGQRVFFPHPLVIVIGEYVKIGDDVSIWHGVTLGSHGRKEMNCEYPVILNRVRLYAGSKVLGAVRVGNDAVIGASAVVNIDVPDASVAVGIPARIL